MKKEIITRVLYLLAIIGFVIYLITKKSEFMFFGGLFLIVASVMLIISNKSKK